jgi:hypothetical protein
MLCHDGLAVHARICQKSTKVLYENQMCKKELTMYECSIYY